MFKRTRFPGLFVLLAILTSLLITACGTGPTTNTGNNNQPLKKVSLGLGYNPDVQFSPFYVAQQKGYFREAGFDVTFNHGIVQDMVGSLTTGKNDFVFVGGDELLVAREKGNIQATNVGTFFQKYPVSLIVPESSSIQKLEDLRGKTIGVPGPFGATYTGLLALLQKAGLTQSDVTIKSINFTQVAALSNKQVDAVMGYSNNEPLQLRKKNFPVRTFDVSDYQPMVSNGLVVLESQLSSNSAQISAFVKAALHGLQDVINNPSEAVEISKNYVPTLTDTQQALDVLNATIPVWKAEKLGNNNEQAWKSMATFLISEKIITKQPEWEKVYTNTTLG